MSLPSIAQLHRAVAIQEQIEKLQNELASVLNGQETINGLMPVTVTKGRGRKAKGKRTMSPEARERIAAAQRARWAKSKGGVTDNTSEASSATKAPKRGKKKRQQMSPEARDRIVAAQKARWAKFRKAKK